MKYNLWNLNSESEKRPAKTYKIENFCLHSICILKNLNPVETSHSHSFTNQSITLLHVFILIYPKVRMNKLIFDEISALISSKINLFIRTLG